MLYDVGDNVYCKIIGTTIVPRTADPYDIILSFEIIGFDKSTNSCIIYIPDYYNIKNKIRIQETQTEEYDLPERFIHKAILLLKADQILNIRKNGTDGMYCTQCKIFIPWAQANQPDGTLKCFQCRQDPWR